MDKISTANFPDSVLHEAMKLDKNHDGFLDTTEISTALTLLSKSTKLSGFGGVVPIVCGKSSKARKLRRDIRNAGCDPQRRTVIISGESGLEKESIATLVHETQGKRDGNLLYRVHCESSSLSELFGTEEKPGLLDQLSDGADSVLISNFDSVARPADLEELQRLFEQRTYRSRFHREERSCSARILAICEQVPDALREASNTTHITVAPLKQRAADLPLIAHTVLQRITRRRGLPRVGLSPDVLHRIKAYGWPDNLREVASALERAVNILEADRPQRSYVRPCLHVPGRDVERVPSVQSASPREFPAVARPLPARLRRRDQVGGPACLPGHPRHALVGPTGAREQRGPDHLLGVVVAARASVLPASQSHVVRHLPLHGGRRVGAGGRPSCWPAAAAVAGGGEDVRSGLRLRAVRCDPDVGGAVGAAGQRGAVGEPLGAHHGGGGGVLGGLREADVVPAPVPHRRHERPLQVRCSIESFRSVHKVDQVCSLAALVVRHPRTEHVDHSFCAPFTVLAAKSR